ncbi:hypothetical protein N658DRAFT_256749 [Parathielavia hyrcaniae]|uniref:Uncharacterized protein n=1 Tax=Parathielavia hyrcaniae TaxID=113614 RepID=A0AAN6PTZ6_9PEZI|nr:hypothetical protein N658DRAFT_256749 [Parathielavia hyrcaniae]
MSGGLLASWRRNERLGSNCYMVLAVHCTRIGGSRRRYVRGALEKLKEIWTQWEKEGICSAIGRWSEGTDRQVKSSHLASFSPCGGGAWSWRAWSVEDEGLFGVECRSGLAGCHSSRQRKLAAGGVSGSIEACYAIEQGKGGQHPKYQRRVLQASVSGRVSHIHWLALRLSLAFHA